MNVRGACSLCLLAVLVFVAGCVSAAGREPPTAEVGPALLPAPTALPATPLPPSPTAASLAYPDAPPYPEPVDTPGPSPTPWPTLTPWPTHTPRPTRQPPEPWLTFTPTPVVTPIPTAAPFSLPFPDGTVAQPFTVYYRAGDAIYSLSSAEGATPQLFLDPWAEFQHYLAPDVHVVDDWGAFSPDWQTLALVLTDDPVSTMIPNSDAWSPAPDATSIYLLDMASRELRLLVPDGLLPVWSPDGRRLAYLSTKTVGLWVVDVASGAAHEVYAVDPPAHGEDSHFVANFAWAFDSRRLSVFHIIPYESHDLLIVDADGLEAPRRVETDPHHPFSMAQWSPVDDRLAYNRVGEGQQAPDDLWIMNGDLTGQRQLTYGLNFPSFGPQWSSDGRWIAISGIASYEAEYATYDVWLIEPDSGAPHRLTYDVPAGSHEEFDGTGQEGSVLWSPDDTQLIYEKDGHQLWVLSLIDGSQRLLLPDHDAIYDSGAIVAP